MDFQLLSANSEKLCHHLNYLFHFKAISALLNENRNFYQSPPRNFLLVYGGKYGEECSISVSSDWNFESGPWYLNLFMNVQ